ncbi:MAG: hypothetical protein IKK41_06375 [Oscillospiraceae bacterium]|nr:hypothetical protein [Oscillospiraceae bacterium]
MKNKKQTFVGVLLAVSLTVLILDSQTSLQGARDGIWLCISVVIPSLYPFLFLSAMLPSRLLGTRIKGIGLVCRLCGIPDGAESLLLLSFLGGYPIGAKMVYDAYRQGCISKPAACRMLGFCNNAGPAFLFGMIGGLFTDKKIVWVLWLIHILSALLVGVLLPGKTSETCILTRKEPLTVPQALESSLKTMGNICGWVVIFRVILTILDRWLLWFLSQEIYAGIFGLFELSNGIACLNKVANDATRFVLCSGMLAFGGLCVFMQTASVTKELGLGRYFPGKVLHCLFSILLSLLFVQLFSI